MSLTAYSESSSVKDYECTIRKNAKYDFNEVQQQQNQTNGKQLKYCYCSQFSFFKLLTTFDEITYECENIFKEQAINFGIDLGITGVIVVLNLIIQEIIFFSVLKVRIVSVTKLVQNQILLALWAEFINTGFVIILVYFEIGGFSFIKLINNMFGREIFTTITLYQDFNRDSYYFVMNKLILPFLLLMVNPHFTELFLSWLIIFWMWLKNKFIKKVQTFIDNNQLKEFDLAYRFKNVLKLLMICFTFSSAMPIMNIVIMFGFLFTFLIHKKIFITYSGKSPSYSSDLILSLISQVKIILLLHLVMAIIFISNKEIFPQNPSFSITQFENDSYSQNQAQDFMIRMVKVLPLVLILGFSIAVFIFKKFIELIIKYLCCCFKSKVNQIKFEKYVEVQKLIKKRGISNYSILSNPKYKPLLFFNKNDLKKIYSLIQSNSIINLMNFGSIEMNQRQPSLLKNKNSQNQEEVLNQFAQMDVPVNEENGNLSEIDEKQESQENELNDIEVRDDQQQEEKSEQQNQEIQQNNYIQNSKENSEENKENNNYGIELDNNQENESNQNNDYQIDFNNPKNNPNQLLFQK